MWLWNGFLIWKGFGKVSRGLDIFSLDLDGSGDLERFLCIWKGFEGPSVSAGMGNLLEKVLQCHSVNITGCHVTG